MGYPFLLQLQLVLTSNASGSLQYTVPNTEAITIKGLIHKSTAGFNITDIRDTSGRHYTNAGSSTPIPNTVIASGANNNNAIKDLGGDIILPGGTGLTIDVTDTSGAGNTIQLTFITDRGDSP
jgi:hypothetical protein